jgi:UPF0755 protein
MQKKMLVLLGTLLALALLGVLGGYFWLSSYATTPLQGEGEQIPLEIPKGAGPRQVAHLLAENRVIDQAGTFYRYLRYIRRAAGKIKAGELAFRDNMTPEEVVDVLVEGTPLTRKITIPEGLRLDEIALLFSRAGLADAKEFEARARDPRLAQALGLPHTSLEGFLFPETYRFRKHTPVDSLLETLVNKYKESFSQAFRKRAREQGMTELEVITLASIVEKETGTAEERAIISGVFHNRLQKGWKLQTDPTVIYAEILTQGSFDGTIHRSDLERNHPYNTYLKTGLPPGPICSAGRAAIHAALYPKKTKYMYFVSKNDGTHKFCADLDCHNRWVSKYQR